jgi:hypothetical protein
MFVGLNDPTTKHRSGGRADSKGRGQTDHRVLLVDIDGHSKKMVAHII